MDIINIITIIGIIWLHFIADFLLQNDWMATNKSKHLLPLIAHSVVYSLPFLLFGPQFAFATGVLHFSVDGISSLITTALWKSNKRHWFFVAIGADQALHLTFLFFTYILFN